MSVIKLLLSGNFWIGAVLGVILGYLFAPLIQNLIYQVISKNKKP